MVILLIVGGYLAGSLLLGVGVGRFIRAGHHPEPPEPDDLPLLTTYAIKPDRP